MTDPQILALGLGIGYLFGIFSGAYYIKKKIEQRKKKAMKEVNDAIGGMINDDEG